MYENAPAANPRDVRGDFAQWEDEQRDYEGDQALAEAIELEAFEREREAKEARYAKYLNDNFAQPYSSADLDMRDYLEGLGT